MAMLVEVEEGLQVRAVGTVIEWAVLATEEPTVGEGWEAEAKGPSEAMAVEVVSHKLPRPPPPHGWSAESFLQRSPASGTPRSTQTS